MSEPVQENLGPVTVQLEQWEYDWAIHAGRQRTLENSGKPDAAHYPDRSRLQDDEIADAHGALAEIAVAKATNRYWSGSYWQEQKHRDNKARPDVGANIGVRRIRQPTGRLVIRPEDVAAKLICFCAYVHQDMRTVTVYGWIDAALGYELGTPAEWDNRTRLVAKDKLNLTGMRGDTHD